MGRGNRVDLCYVVSFPTYLFVILFRTLAHLTPTPVIVWIFEQVSVTCCALFQVFCYVLDKAPYLAACQSCSPLQCYALLDRVILAKGSSLGTEKDFSFCPIPHR